MQIEKARELGFCFGVRRAIALMERAAQRGPLQTLGPVIHNHQVVERLKAMGVGVAGGLDDISGEVVAISSHGVAPQVLQALESRRLKVIDATCPFVRRVQLAAQRLAKAGFYIVIFGDATHSEVQGILGWAGSNAIATLESLRLEELPRHVGIISQTTQSSTRFAQFLRELLGSGIASLSELRIINSICEATRRRQQAAWELAERVELMVVVGGHHSANTRQLAASCIAAGVETHHIETAAEIASSWLNNRSHIGVTAGASTPDQVIDEVIAKLEQMSGDK